MPSPFRVVLLPLVLPLALATGCATLGPTPRTTAISPVAAGRTTVEVSAGGVPGYYLSASTVAEPKGSPIGQLSAVVEPGPALGIPGLIIGGRAVGPEHDVQAEPILGMRRTFGADGDFSGLAVVHGTHARAKDRGAQYEATRIGGEVAADFRVLGQAEWFEPHLFASVSITGIDASGDYCLDADGQYGIDCPMMGGAPAEHTRTDVSGVYPAATVGVAVHGLAHRATWFHGARAAMMISGGAMPRVVAGSQEQAGSFFTLGLVLSLAVGSDH